jgi:hypothetical protein
MHSKYIYRLREMVFLAASILVTWLPCCSSGYSVKDGKAFFNGKEISENSFRVLNDDFAKDSSTAYYRQYPFSYADVATFQALDDHYAKDRNKAYYCDEYREGQNYYMTKKQAILEVDNALPPSFITINNGYAKDKKRAYFHGIAFPVKNVSTLTSIDPFFAKDNIRGYLNQQVIAGSHGRTFEVTDRHFAKDSAHVYYYGYTGEGSHNITILPCDKASFQILDYRYSKDKEKVFFLGFILQHADPNTFKILSSGYAMDSGKVYYMSKRMAGVDVASFKVFGENDLSNQDVSYAKDKNTVYMNEKRFTLPDPKTFTILGENYSHDGKNVFYKTATVINARPSSFKVYPHDVGNADAEDLTGKFHEGRKVED